MPQITVNDFLALSIEEANNPNARNEIRGKIASSLQNGKFTFIDLTNCVQVKLATEQLAGEIATGQFVRLLRPQRSSSSEFIILDENSRVLPSRKIRGLENSVPIDVPSSTSNEGTTIADIKKLDPYQVIKSFLSMSVRFTIFLYS